LANELGAGQACPAILLQGAATAQVRQESQNAAVQRVGRVSILAVNDRFWLGGNDSGGADLWRSDRDEVVINAALATDLGVGAGDSITLHLQKISVVPRETLLGRRDASEVLDELKLQVREVIANAGLGRFSLTPSAATLHNAFVPLRTVQKKLHELGR